MNTAIKRTLLSTLVVPFALGAASASAAPITEWGYQTTNVFDSATFSSGTGSQTEEAQLLSWGGTGTDRSSVTITDVNEERGLVTDGDFVSGGVFTHNNRIISDQYAALTGFDLITTLQLTEFLPNAGANARTVGPTTFESSFSETRNRAPCTGDSNGIPCDDIFTLDNLSETAGPNAAGWYELSADAFTVDDFSYTVFLELQFLAPLGETTCGVAGAPANCIGLLTEENNQNTFETRFRIASTPVSVPEPGTLALLGLSLAGLGLSSRKKAAKA